MTKASVIRRFVLSITGLPFSIRKADHWETNGYDTILYCLTTDDSDIAFRADFIRRCPLADTYMDVTLSILHELGHCFTAENADGIYPDENTCTDQEYFAVHDEMIATDWAINWLHNKDNQTLAKQFEQNWLTSR